MARLSPEQCRAARALLDWQQRDLSLRSKVSRESIANFERGRTVPWARTLDDLREAFEEAGIEFLDAQPGVGGIGLRMREGFNAFTKTDDTQTDTGSKGKAGLDTLGWEGDADGADLEATPPLSWTDVDRTNQIVYWRGRPEKWAALAEVSRQCLLRAMGVERL